MMRRILCCAAVLVACGSEEPSNNPGSGGELQGSGGDPGAGGFPPGVGGFPVGSGSVPAASGGVPMGMGGGLPGAGGLPIATGGTDPGGAGGIDSGGGGMASGGMDPGTTGGAAGSGGVDGTGGTPGTGGSADPPPGMRQAGCEGLGTLPAATDYGARGPYQVQTVNNTGPSNQYTLFRPATFDPNGLHPPVSWGNGVATTPALYIALLETVASHGFVVIGSNSTTMTAQLVRQGLEWLIAQNGATFQNKLAVNCGATIGYSMGGGSAVGAGSHPAVRAVVSLHGLTGPAGQVSGPLLLINSTSDGFVSKAQYTVPTYNQSSTQPTVMATLDNGPNTGFAGHLVPLGDAGPERAPLVAWLRLWLYGDQGARPWFYGPNCTVCTSPWIDIQRKNHAW